MRYFHKTNQKDYTPTINVDKLWTLVSEQTRTHYAKATSGKVPVIDCIKAGYFKVLGKGSLPNQPVIVRAKYFTRDAEAKIKAVGGIAELAA